MNVNGSLIDTNLRQLIVGQLGNDEAQSVLKAMETFMLENNVITAPPLVGDGQTKGDWRINLTMPDGQKQDIRPDNALSYTIIREMLKSGPIRFALEMKRAQMVSVFRNRRSVSAYCKNQEMQQVTEFVVEHVLPFAAFEFTWSALVYGAAFMEQVWETKTLSQLGLDGSKYYTVPKQLNLVPHETVRHILRDNQGNFDGFVQMADYKLGSYYIISTPSTGVNPGDVNVKLESALVIPYNGFSRNLWGESFLYPLYPLWFWYEIIIRALVRYSELMGDPPRLAKAPSRKKVRLSPTSTELVDAIDYMLALAVNLTKSNAVAIPSDRDENNNEEWSLEYMVTPDRSQPFVQILEMFNSMILRAALSGDRAYSQVQGQGVPSAIGQIGSEATSLHNEMVVSSWLHYLNRYWVSKISKYNLGTDGVPVWLEVQGLDPKERELLTAIAGIAGNSSTFQEFFYMVDWEALGKNAGLPMLTKDQAKQLKEELSKQQQESQVDQIRTQNELNIENMQQQAEVEKSMGIGQFAPPPPGEEKPTNLEVQMQIDRLTAGEVPIFLTNEELKKLAIKEEETATPQNFFIPSLSNNLPLALAVAYKYQLIGNPYHDTLGRFAPKQGITSQNVKKVYKTGAALVQQGEILDKAEYKKFYGSLSSNEKSVIATPEQYDNARKKLTRTTVEVGLEAAFSWTIASAAFTNGSLLGAAATATVATALFGAVAPSAALVIGGLIVGAGASAIATQMFRKAKEEHIYAYLDRKVFTGNNHVGFVHNKNKQHWRTGLVEMFRTGTNEVAFDVAVSAFGSYVGIPGSWSVTNALIKLEGEIKDEGDADDFAAFILPYISGMVVGKINSVRMPMIEGGYPGFFESGDSLIMTRNTMLEFLRAWNDELSYRTIEFGNTQVELSDIELENIQLFNSAHDSLGRFASKSGSAAQLVGGLEGKRQVDLVKAQRMVNKTVKAMGKRLESGLVPGLQTKLCNDWTCVKKETGISGNALGVYYKEKLVMTPHGLTYSTYDSTKFFDRVVAHESVHARKRSGGKGITFTSQSQVDLEEGCTEMISMGFTKYPYQKSPYIKQMRSVAAAARKGSNGNVSNAWKIVSLMHYHNDTIRGLSAYRAYGQGKNRGSDADIEWLLGDVPTKLELEDDEKEFATSEAVIYRTVRKVRQKTFKITSKPFTDEELK